MAGWIKLHRSLIDWEWYTDANTSRVFIHLLLTANHKPNKWHGVKVGTGQVVIGRKKLAELLQMSEQNIRTALSKLKSTNEITSQPTNKYTLITILKWEDYQCLDDSTNQQINQQPNRRLTNNQPTTNQQLTTNKKVKKVKNEENDNKDTVETTKTDYKHYLDLWNSECMLSNIRTLSDKRRTTLKARIDEHGENSFQEVIILINKSEFLKGDNERNWKATFDWVVNVNNYLKIIECNYENKTTNQKPTEGYYPPDEGKWAWEK